MTYGIQCVNDSGELTLSADAFTFAYLGKATYVSTTTAHNTSSFASTSGFSTYHFTYAGPIVCAIGLTSTHAGSTLLSMSQSGSVWTIVVWDLLTTTESPTVGGTYQQQATSTDVYVFGLPDPSSLSPWGSALYNSSGTLVCDLLKKALTPLARISMAAGVATQTIPSVVKPAIVGYPHLAATASSGSGSSFTLTGYRGLWEWGGGTTLARSTSLSDWEHDAEPGTNTSSILACDALLIEANGLT